MIKLFECRSTKQWYSCLDSLPYHFMMEIIIYSHFHQYLPNIQQFLSIQIELSFHIKSRKFDKCIIYKYHIQSLFYSERDATKEFIREGVLGSLSNPCVNIMRWWSYWLSCMEIELLYQQIWVRSFSTICTHDCYCLIHCAFVQQLYACMI